MSAQNPALLKKIISRFKKAKILIIGDLRSELSRLQLLRPRGPVYLGGQAVEYIPQKKQNEIAQLISELEQRKADLDKILQSSNWKTELLQ